MGSKTAEGLALFSVSEILEATGGRLLRGESRRPVSGVSIDSRTIRPGELFVAIRGERFDGHRFVYDALGRGACGVMVNISGHRIPTRPEEEALFSDKVLIGVSDTVAGLQDLSGFHRNRFKLSVAGITGSNGKTTTKEMAAEILAERYPTLRTEGNLNNHIGVPLTLLRLDRSHQAAVLEMGISRPGELRRLAELVRPSVGLITNIGPAHLEGLGDLETVARSKGDLLDALSPEEGLSILNRDDAFYETLRARASGRTVAFGWNPEADVAVRDSAEESGGLDLTLLIRPSIFGMARPSARGGGRPPAPRPFRLRLGVIGRHNASNAAAAAAVGAVMGCGPEDIRRGLERFRPKGMRTEIRAWGGRTIINDAYNANPASVRAALEMLARHPGPGGRVAVLGPMLELGPEAAGAHREIGAAAAKERMIRLITVGSAARGIAEGARAAGMDPARIDSCEEPAEAAAILKETAGPSDVILIKGSRGARMERVLESLGLEV